jgi:hypothetical protein
MCSFSSFWDSAPKFKTVKKHRNLSAYRVSLLKSNQASADTILTVNLHYELTTWSRVLEKLIVAQLVKKFLAFYGNRRLIIVFIRACH